jgi:putative ABC transport system substrate-binding protein
MWRIAVLGGSPPTTPEAARPWEALMQGLRELGYVEGQNLTVERRWAEGRAERYNELAAELVALRPDVIVAAFTPSVSAAKRATSTIPIVMAIAGDPVGTGLVASLARPGGNITGMSLQNSPELAGKRLELLKKALPSVSRVGLLVNRSLPHREFIWRDLQRAALQVGVTLHPFEVSGPEDFTIGLTAKASDSFQALVVHPDPLAFNHRREIADFGLKKKIPVMAAYGFAEAGCLISYDAYWPDLYRRAASYVDKILKGAKPADLPLQQPTKFDLVINMKTARALGLTLAPSFLQRADSVIE